MSKMDLFSSKSTNTSNKENNNSIDQIEEVEDFNSLELPFRITDDLIFKKVFSNTIVVSSLVYDLIGKELDCTKQEIYDALPRENPDDNFLKSESQEQGGMDSTKTIRDVIFTLKLEDKKELKIKINLEMERSRDVDYDLVKRALVYASQDLVHMTGNNITSTLCEDGKQTKSSKLTEDVKAYEKIIPVYTIWICGAYQLTGDSKLPKKYPLDIENQYDFLHHYCLGRKVKNGLSYHNRSNYINLIFIELPALTKAYKKLIFDKDSLTETQQENIEYLFEEYTDFVDDFQELFNKATVNIQDFSSLKQGLEIRNKVLYEGLKEVSDMYMTTEERIRKEGILEGILEGEVNLIKALILSGMEINDISEKTNKPLDFVLEIKNSILENKFLEPTEKN